ncbi:MAG: gamma carbonic anhydrase family protein [Gammaproteobacteria bacterium]|nr:gamma carbonic anhydrase family protein [Gammaproteobacteria bacterium]
MNVRSYQGLTPSIHASAYVDLTALVIGDVEIAEHASIWPMCVVRGDVQRIQIGACSNIQDGCVLHVTHDSEYKPGGLPLLVGEGVTVGHNVSLHACAVGHYCLIGIGSVILDGAVLHDKVMLGAGSLVTPGRVLEGGFLWVGRPAKRVRPLTDKELEYLEYSAAHYVKLKNRHSEA